MKRLVTFGCSLTYGQFLEDRETQSWPAQLGSRLNVPVVNMGMHGSSNKEILYEILNFDFQSDDVCVIMWTNVYRWIIFNEEENNRLGAWQDTKQARAFVEYFWFDYDMCLDLFERANHANRIIPHSYHLVSNNLWLKNEPIWNKVNFLTHIDFHSIRKNYPEASDGKHPGELAYTDLAKKLHNAIRS